MLTPEDIGLYLSAFEGLKLQDVTELAGLARTKTLAVGEVYIREGSVTQKLAFIRKGLLRAYGVKKNGQDATLFLRWEGQFIASSDSIILKRPSKFRYEALEETILDEMDFTEVQPVIDRSPVLSSLRDVILMQMLAQAMERVEGFVFLTPEERYSKFVREKPDIINRVPGKYLATLLGITPISLSRIRRRMADGARKR